VLPKIAVVTPVRNRREKTLSFLASMTCQSYPELTQIIVDSNSSDGTPDAILEQYPKTVLLKASDHDYWAGATNIGVKFALQEKYEFIFTVNDDSTIDPSYIEKMVSLSKRSNLLVLGSRINYLNCPNLVWALGIATKWGQKDFMRPSFHKCAIKDLPDSIWSSEVLETDALPGNAVLVHHSVYEKVGLYNSLLTPHHLADAEFTLRARSQGLKVWVTPHLVIFNDFSESQKKINLSTVSGIYSTFFRKKSYLFVWAWLYIFMRYCPLKYKWVTLCSIFGRIYLHY
jgi:GT2 family glycosyltransferase